MSQIKILTQETVSQEGKPVLEAAVKKYGFVPNLIGALANAPVAAEAYLALGNFVRQSSFSPTERHVVWFALNAYHGCDYCMAAHTGIAHAENIPQQVIDTARDGGAYADPKLEALRTLTLKLAEQRGWVDDADIATFLAAGYAHQQVVEIVVAISHKVLSNYTNHLADTPLDANFEKYAWTRPTSVAAE